jgi:hypothetical protein
MVEQRIEGGAGRAAGGVDGLDKSVNKFPEHYACQSSTFFCSVLDLADIDSQRSSLILVAVIEYIAAALSCHVVHCAMGFAW